MKEGKNAYYLEGIATRNSKIITEIYQDILPGITTWVKQNGGHEEDAKDLFHCLLYTSPSPRD